MPGAGAVCLQRRMSLTTYRLIWPDQAVSLVTVDVDATGHMTVQIRGSRNRLATLLDYKTPAAVAAEIAHVARRGGAAVTREVDPGSAPAATNADGQPG